MKAWAKSKIEEKKDEWATGSFDASFQHEHMIRDACAKGYISGMNDVLDIELEDLTSE